MKVTFKEVALILVDNQITAVIHQYCNRVVFANTKNTTYYEVSGILEIGHNELNNIKNVENGEDAL